VRGFGLAIRLKNPAVFPGAFGFGMKSRSWRATGSIRVAGMRFPGNGSRTKLLPDRVVVRGS